MVASIIIIIAFTTMEALERKQLCGLFVTCVTTIHGVSSGSLSSSSSSRRCCRCCCRWNLVVMAAVAALVLLSPSRSSMLLDSALASEGFKVRKAITCFLYLPCPTSKLGHSCTQRFMDVAPITYTIEGGNLTPSHSKGCLQHRYSLWMLLACETLHLKKPGKIALSL